MVSMVTNSPARMVAASSCQMADGTMVKNYTAGETVGSGRGHQPNMKTTVRMPLVMRWLQDIMMITQMNG